MAGPGDAGFDDEPVVECRRVAQHQGAHIRRCGQEDVPGVVGVAQRATGLPGQLALTYK